MTAALPPVFVINLPQSHARRAFMQAQLAAQGIEPVFFTASDGRREDLGSISRYQPVRALRLMGHPMSPAEVGCFASHYRLWHHCVELDRPLLVMEDDVRVQPRFAEALAQAARLTDRLHYIRLGAMFRRRYRHVARLDDGFELVRYLKGPYGLQCYLVSPSGARRLIEHAGVWIKAVDAYVDSFWQHGLAPYAILPLQAQSDPDHAAQSTIGADRFTRHRPWHHALRRNLTHLALRLRRHAFNLRHRDPRW